MFSAFKCNAPATTLKDLTNAAAQGDMKLIPVRALVFSYYRRVTGPRKSKVAVNSYLSVKMMVPFIYIMISILVGGPHCLKFATFIYDARRASTTVVTILAVTEDSDCDCARGDSLDLY
jgi:hypothetical protein